MGFRRSFVAFLLGTAVLGGGRSVAQGACNLSSRWASANGIPVQVNTSLPGHLCTAVACPTLDDLRRVTQVAMDDIFESGGANVRFTYPGDANIDEDDFIPGGIHVTVSRRACEVEGGYGDARDFNHDGYIDSCRVELCRGDWTSMTPEFENFENQKPFQKVVTHELLHCLGLDHPADCAQQHTATILNAQGAPARHHLFEDDMDGLRMVYGTRNQTIHAFASSDGLSWSPSVAPPALANQLVMSRLSACQTASGNAMFVSFPDINGNHSVIASRFDGSTWTTPNLLTLAASPYHTGTACASSTDALVAWLGGYDLDTGDTSLYVSRTTNGGATWTISLIERFAGSNVGVAATYDPASGRYLMAHRQDGNSAVRTTVFPDGVSTTLNWGSDRIRSADSVGLACGDPAVVGPRNCMLTWVSTEWDRFLHWVKGSIQDDPLGQPIFVFDSTHVQADAIVVFGQPSVAYTGDPAYPWLLSFHHDRLVRVLRHGPSDATTWQPVPPVAIGVAGVQAITSPILGTLDPSRGISRFVLFASERPATFRSR
jgi:hypothetical protein